MKSSLDFPSCNYPTISRVTSLSATWNPALEKLYLTSRNINKRKVVVWTASSDQLSLITYSTAILISIDEELAFKTTSILLEKNYVSLYHNIYRYSHTGGHIIYSWQTVYMCVCVCVHPTVKGKLFLLTDSKPDLNSDPEQQQPM